MKAFHLLQTHSSEISAIGNICLSLFTIVLAVATCFLWWSTRKLVQATEAHGTRQLRAYVSLEKASVSVVNLIEGGKGIMVQVELKNYGQTPAYSFSTWIHARVRHRDDVPFGEAKPPNEKNGSSIIGPGSSAHMHLVFSVNESELIEIQANTKRAFVWGGADYKDFSNVARRFVFRDVNAQGLFTSPGNTLGLGPHRAGYEAN